MGDRDSGISSQTLPPSHTSSEHQQQSPLLLDTPFSEASDTQRPNQNSEIQSERVHGSTAAFSADRQTANSQFESAHDSQTSLYFISNDRQLEQVKLHGPQINSLFQMLVIDPQTHNNLC